MEKYRNPRATEGESICPYLLQIMTKEILHRIRNFLDIKGVTRIRKSSQGTNHVSVSISNMELWICEFHRLAKLINSLKL